MKKTNRKTKQIKVLNHIHTLIEQDDRANTGFGGNYMGHTGFVLKKVEQIKID